MIRGTITRDEVTYEFRTDDHDPTVAVVLVSGGPKSPEVGGSFSVPAHHAEALFGTLVRGMAKQPARVCRFLLRHGRTKIGSPTDVSGNEVDDWGFNGPVLENVLAWHFTYGDAGRMFFATSEDAAVAQHQTGWKYFDGNALQVPSLVEDLLPAGGHYFGDWEIQAKPEVQ